MAMNEPGANDRTGSHGDRAEDQPDPGGSHGDRVEHQPDRAGTGGGGELGNRSLQNVPEDARRDEEPRDRSSDDAATRDNRAAAPVPPRADARVTAVTVSAERVLAECVSAERRLAERSLLAALCQNALNPAARIEVLRRLAGCVFADPEHEVIFRALANVPVSDPERTRAALGIRITRLGFPDFDLDPFFNIKPPDASEFAALFALLEI